MPSAGGRYTCSGPADCLDGYACVVDDSGESVCLKAAAGDAGSLVDGGEHEGGVGDGGSVDAGADAGGFDGGVVDGGVVDGGVLDGGVLDGGVLDGGDAGGFFCPLDDSACAPLVGFSPQLAKRASEGPFEVGVMLQGDARHPSDGTGDVLLIPRGDLVAGSTFYARGDSGQGTALAWITPEWDASTLPAPVMLWEIAGFRVGVEPMGDVVVVGGSGASERVAGAWSFAAGTPHLVALRWDEHAPVEGSANVTLTLDDVTYPLALGVPSAPQVNQRVGVMGASGDRSANALIAGLTVYRRPLASGGGGVDTGAGDELAALYAAGAGKDPTRVTGSWDVVLALPTDQAEGALASTGQAWSHPHAQNLLGTRAFALGSSFDGSLGSFSSIAFSGSTSLFGSGVSIQTSSSSAGRYFQIPSAGGTSYVLRALAHSDGDSLPHVRVSCLDGGDVQDVARLSGTSSSTRGRPDQLLFTFETPPSCPQLRVLLSNASGNDDRAYFHQLELYENLVEQPSMEAGTVENGNFLPTGWRQDNTVPSSSTSQAPSVAHSGTYSLRFSLSGNGTAHLRFEPAGLIDGGYYAVGGFFRWSSGFAPRIIVTNGSLWNHSKRLRSSNQDKFRAEGALVADVWQHVGGVGRRLRDSTLNNHNDILRWGGSDGPGETFVDDAYVFPLEAVQIAVAPADVTASTKNNLLRIDGEDGATQDIAPPSQASRLEMQLQPGRPVGAPVSSCAPPYALFTLVGDADDYVAFIVTDMGLTGEVSANGSVTVTALGAELPFGALTSLELSPAMGDLAVRVDGVARGTLPIGAFGTEPSQGVFGADASGARRCDLLLRLPGALVLP